jgi:putative ABC transport system permease protein
MRGPDLAGFSLRAITAYPLRSSLTALGIVIGITAVVLLTSIGEGLHRFILAEFTQFGTNLIAVTPGKNVTYGLSGATISTVRPLALADAEALRRLDHVEAVSPVVQGNARVEYGDRERRTMVFGLGPDAPIVWKHRVAAGQYLPAGDGGASRSYAVLGAKVRDELFGDGNPLGARIRIGEDQYRVIGAMEHKGTFLGFDLDDTVAIAADQALTMFNRESLMEIDVLYKAGVDVKTVETAIKRLLIARHGREDFSLITQEQMLRSLGSVLNVMTIAVAALGGISLLVGAVGILTIMTIAVTERVSEIGLLRALGAEQGQVLRIFLGEAVLLGGAGGVAGIVAGLGLVRAIAVFLPSFPVRPAWGYIAVALALSLIIGLGAGIAPALRAARLPPLEALRTE